MYRAMDSLLLLRAMAMSATVQAMVDATLIPPSTRNTEPVT
jgi:hypothetical protein